MNHGKEGVPHEAKSRCSYSHQYDNRVYTCKVSPELLLAPAAGRWSLSCRKDWLGAALLHPRVFDVQMESLWNFSPAL